MLKEHHGGDDRKVERAGDLEDRVLGKTVLWRGHGCSTPALTAAAVTSQDLRLN